MQILKTDVLTYNLSFKVDGEIETILYKTFSAAAGAAEALKIRHSFLILGFKATSPNGDSSMSASLYHYKNGGRKAIHQHYIKAIVEIEAMR